MEEAEVKIKQTGTIDLERQVLSYGVQFLIGAVLISLFLLLGFGAWLLASKNSLKNWETKISDLDRELSNLKDVEKEMQVFSGAVSNIQGALSQKKKWPYIFKELQNVTPKDIVLDSFTVDEKGKVKIDGNAPSLDSLAKALVAFKQDKEDPQKENPVFKNVTLGSFSIAKDKVSFSISMETKGAK